MEFPCLGKRCDVPSCLQLDFLPFKCESCKRIHCVSHKGRDAHDCPDPLSVETFVDVTSTSKSYSCELEGCKLTELVSVHCPDCHKNFCLKHRHSQDHQCEESHRKSEPMLTPKQKVEAVIGRELKSDRREPKTKKLSKTAAKVALMKLKMHAVGEKSIPQVDREYFNVQLPHSDKGNQTSISPMFFNKVWTVGKIIDNVADMKKLRNQNNVSGEKKLRLFNENDDMLTSSDSLQHLIDNGEIQLDSARLLKLCYTDPG